jgi:hypothetical protein
LISNKRPRRLEVSPVNCVRIPNGANFGYVELDY